MVAFPQRVAALCLVLLAGGCAGTDEEPGTFMPSGKLAVQPYPDNYRADILAFMHTYLNDLQSVRGASIASPEQRMIGGRSRYVVCLRYSASGQGDVASGGGERAAVFVDGRMERLIEKGRELCTGATYTPFPDMEKLVR
ncbi:MAG: hypothetical protein P4M07_22510 [Xanthobacteraceae bacterium]|nr:hypothetical protein [Xanthobacteraceae bacterium]